MNEDETTVNFQSPMAAAYRPTVEDELIHQAVEQLQIAQRDLTQAFESRLYVMVRNRALENRVGVLEAQLTTLRSKLAELGLHYDK